MPQETQVGVSPFARESQKGAPPKSSETTVGVSPFIAEEEPPAPQKLNSETMVGVSPFEAAPPQRRASVPETRAAKKPTQGEMRSVRVGDEVPTEPASVVPRRGTHAESRAAQVPDEVSTATGGKSRRGAAKATDDAPEVSTGKGRKAPSPSQPMPEEPALPDEDGPVLATHPMPAFVKGSKPGAGAAESKPGKAELEGATQMRPALNVEVSDDVEDPEPSQHTVVRQAPLEDPEPSLHTVVRMAPTDDRPVKGARPATRLDSVDTDASGSVESQQTRVGVALPGLRPDQAIENVRTDAGGNISVHLDEDEDVEGLVTERRKALPPRAAGAKVSPGASLRELIRVRSRLLMVGVGLMAFLLVAAVAAAFLKPPPPTPRPPVKRAVASREPVDEPPADEPVKPLVKAPPKKSEMWLEVPVDGGPGQARVDKIRAGMLRVTADPPVELFIAGRSQGTTPVSLVLAVGVTRAVIVNNQIGLRRNVELTVVADQLGEENFSFSFGQLEIHAPPTATVRVDGRPVSERLVRLLAGTHKVEASFANGKAASQNVQVIPGETSTAYLEADMQEH